MIRNLKAEQVRLSKTFDAEDSQKAGYIRSYICVYI